MCLLDGVLVEVQALRWVVHHRLVFASLLAVLERQITRYNHGNSRRFVIYCDGYSFGLVANDGLFESPRPPRPI